MAATTTVGVLTTVVPAASHQQHHILQDHAVGGSPGATTQPTSRQAKEAEKSTHRAGVCGAVLRVWLSTVHVVLQVLHGGGELAGRAWVSQALAQLLSKLWG